MYREILIEANKPITEGMAKIASAFSDAGWDVQQIDGYNDVQLVSPAAINGKYLVVRLLTSADEITSDTPHGSFRWGVNLRVAVRGATDFSPVFATTVFHGGVYPFVINDYGFIIVPPETQPRRFMYGTWVTLLRPVDGLTLPLHSGDYTPLLVATDRIVGEKERRFPHTTRLKPTNYILFANGTVSQEMRVMHPQGGRKTLLERDTHNYLCPMALLVEEGGYFIPVYTAAAWFIEVNPKQPIYLPVTSAYDRGDFLAERVLPFGVRVVACGELPPDGAKLLSVF